MKTKIVISAVILLIVIAVVSFKEKTNDDEIVIGMNIPLTVLGEYGEAIRNGVEMASEDFETKEKGVRFVYEDNAYSGTDSVSAHRKLSEFNNVDISFVWGTNPGEAVIPIADQYDSFVVAGGFGDPDVTKYSESVVRHMFSYDELAEKIWKYLRSKDMKNIGIIKTNIAFLNGIAISLEEQARENESVVVVESIDSFDERDFRTIIVKLKNSDIEVDALGVFMINGQISQFFLQADQLGLDIPTFGTDFFESTKEISDARGTMEGTVYPSYLVSEEFRERYIEQHGNDAQISYAANAYDFVGILMNNKIDYTNKESIGLSFSKISSFGGVGGTYTYEEKNGDRAFVTDFAMKQIVGDSIVELP